MITLTPAQMENIHAQAGAAYPYECCGLLAGCIEDDSSITVTRVVPSPNVLQDEHTGSGKDSFEVDPQVRFDLMRAIQNTDEEIIGHYHSHPDHPAKPSKTDIGMAFEPDMIWVIVEVRDQTCRNTTAWKLDRQNQSAQPCELVIAE